jgi:DnaJ-class molecular chaperone
VPSVDGEITVTVPAGTMHGDTIRIKNQGFPTRSGRGDLQVIVSVEIPKKLSKSAKEYIQKLREEGI